MKKLISVSFLISFYFFGFAQFPVTVSYNENDVTDQTINLKRDQAMYFTLTNPIDHDINVTVELVSISLPSKSIFFQVCWKTCHQPFNPQIIETNLVSAGSANEKFDVLYNNDGNTDPANASFHIYEDGNSADYITLTLDTETAGVNDISQTGDITIYPNPANDYFSIKLPDNIKNPELKISNIIGKTVLKTSINSSKTKVNIKDLPSGIYFVSVISNGIIIDTKKLIVK